MVLGMTLNCLYQLTFLQHIGTNAYLSLSVCFSRTTPRRHGTAVDLWAHPFDCFYQLQQRHMKLKIPFWWAIWQKRNGLALRSNICNVTLKFVIWATVMLMLIYLITRQLSFFSERIGGARHRRASNLSRVATQWYGLGVELTNFELQGRILLRKNSKYQCKNFSV